MATEIANAYVALYTTMPGVKGDIERQLGKADAEGAGKKIGKRASDGAGKGFALGGAVAGITAVLVAGAAQSIGALVSEAVDASDATDKFKKTLDFAGVDGGQIESLSKSTRAYADSTVYDLSTIQNTVAQLAANGVKDYDKLAEAGGNLNAVAGGNAETFKSVGTVLTQTAGAGKLTTENWNQLADAIPGASGLLQDSLLKAGAYTGNFREAMEKGEISADEFNAAILELGSQPVAIEAAKSVETFEGAVGSLRATIVGGLMDALTAMKPAITGAIAGLATGLQWLFDMLKEIGSGIDFGGLLELASFLSPLSLVFQVLQPILPLIASTLGEIAAVFGDALAAVLPVILPVLAQLVTLLADLAAQVIPMLLPIITMLAGVFAELLVAVMPIIAQLVTALFPIIEALIPVVLLLLDAFMPLIMALADALTPILTVIADVLAAVLVPILDIVINIIKVLANVITWLVKNVIVPFFIGILIPAVQQVGQIFEDVFSGLGGFFEGLWSGISTGFKGMVNFIIDLINGFISGLNEVGNFISDATGGAVDFNIGRIPRLGDGATVLPRAGGTLAVLAERGRAETVVDTGLMNKALAEGIRGGGLRPGDELALVVDGAVFRAYVQTVADGQVAQASSDRRMALAAGARKG